MPKNEPLLDPDVEYVVKALASQTPRDRIIREVIQRRNSNWQSAERFIGDVEVEHHRRIKGGQLPFMLIMVVFFFLFGLGMTFAGGYFLWLNVASGPGRVGRGQFEFPLLLLTTGPGLVLGSVVGAYRLMQDMGKDS